MRKCPNNHVLNGRAQFCPQCGAESPPTEVLPTPKHKNKILLTVGAILGLFVVIAIGSFVINGSSSSSSSDATSAPSAPQSPSEQCYSTLYPWVNYLITALGNGNGQTADISQWVDAVGTNNPIESFPLFVADGYLVNKVEVGSQQAVTLTQQDLNKQCDKFVQANPNYDFSQVPAASSGGG